MTSIRFDVVGIGNAIVDIISRCENEFLVRHGLPKGHMQLIDTGAMQRLYAEMGPATEISGGSAANTMAGIASFGGTAAFIGKVADDELGRIFGHDLRAAGVAFDTPRANGSLPTARSLILVTPDGERTMNTFLGVSPTLDRGEIDAAAIEAARITYLEGYLFDLADAKAAFHEAAGIARKARRQVALSLSDAFCVDRHRAELLGLIRGSVDILFANESELKSLYETHSWEDAVAAVRRDCALVAATRSAKGSLILAGDRTIEVAAEPVATVVDTTGAGDLYAAGFLIGHAKGHDLKTCGRLASLAAAEVISHIGARPQVPLAGLARAAGLPV